MVEKIISVPKHDEGTLIEKINSMSESQKKETAINVAETLLEDARTPVLDDSIGNLTQSFNIALLAGLDQDERTMMVSHKLAIAMSNIISLQNNFSADVDINGPSFSDNTKTFLQSRLKYLNFSEFSIYIRQKDGSFVKKTVYSDKEFSVEKIDESKLGLNMENLLSGKGETTGFNFKISQIPVEGIGEDFAIAINNNIFIAGDDYDTAREISHSIELFEMIGIVIQKAIEKQERERDHLTSLLNRKTFTRYIEGKSGFFIMFDIDKFKRVNDTYGHDVGDKVIKKVAEIIETHTKIDRDVVCRWGGEEIAVFLSTVRTRVIPRSVAAKKAAERIRKAIEDYDWSDIFGTEDGITISGGISRYKGDLDDSYKKADLKLYEAKEGGRNQITYHKDELDELEEENEEKNKRKKDRRKRGIDRRKS